MVSPSERFDNLVGSDQSTEQLRHYQTGLENEVAGDVNDRKL